MVRSSLSAITYYEGVREEESLRGRSVTRLFQNFNLLNAFTLPVEQRFAAEGIERQVGEALRPVAVLPAIEFRLNQPPHRPEPRRQPVEFCRNAQIGGDEYRGQKVGMAEGRCLFGQREVQ